MRPRPRPQVKQVERGNKVLCLCFLCFLLFHSLLPWGDTARWAGAVVAGPAAAPSRPGRRGLIGGAPARRQGWPRKPCKGRSGAGASGRPTRRPPRLPTAGRLSCGSARGPGYTGRCGRGARAATARAWPRLPHGRSAGSPPVMSGGRAHVVRRSEAWRDQFRHGLSRRTRPTIRRRHTKRYERSPDRVETSRCGPLALRLPRPVRLWLERTRTHELYPPAVFPGDIPFPQSTSETRR
jgi:hypothetical protein